MQTTELDDLNALFLDLSPQLRRVLGRNLRAPEWIVDDACQTAWEAFLAAERPVPLAHLLGWLATTARREALLLLARAEADLSLDDEKVVPRLPPRRGVDPGVTAELRDHLGQIRVLSPRQQRLMWMRGLGFRYEEMSARAGLSQRTVQRQLMLAQRRLKSLSTDDAA